MPEGVKLTRLFHFAKIYNPNKTNRGNEHTSDIPKYKDNEYDN